MHKILFFFYDLTKNLPMFHRMAARVVLHLELPLIELILKNKFQDRIKLIQPRHSLLEKNGFNLFMSDIDLSIVLKDEKDIHEVLTTCWDLKRIFLNLGEQEVYLPKEWELLTNLLMDPHHKTWTSIFQIRKLAWQKDNLSNLSSEYDIAKFYRGINRSLKSLGMKDDKLQAEVIFPFIPTNLRTSVTADKFPFYNDFLCQMVFLNQTSDEPGIYFDSPASATFFGSLLPLANDELRAPWEDLRIYLLQRELLMAKCHLRILIWSRQDSKVPKISEWVQILKAKLAVEESTETMNNIEVILHKNESPGERLSIFFNLHTTPIAQKYFEILKVSCDRNDPIYEPERTYNFPGDTRDNAWIAKRLNECIDIINAHSPVIHYRAMAEMDQEHMNHLHKYFEMYRGPIKEPPTFFVEAPKKVKRALEEYNVLIHRYEDYNRNLEYVRSGQRPAAKIVVTYAKPRELLAEEDFQHFSTRTVFGRYYLNYCEVGKPIWDMYQDNDEVVGEENILPLKYYSADAMIEFSATSPVEVDQENMKKFYQWWDRNMGLMDSLGFTQHDPKNAIGHIPLADLDRNRGAISGLTELEIIHLIGQYPIIAEVRVHPV